eukprot:TRINITY_DN1384_c0_g3_i1.p1 TRINITY_DN1384_c0_g3~~TRINITY_DN1384_c0_g3_i1.p1  ORF type:complete len:856 (+),score=197.57 TRINITY_DN1384_c0_g3_i1:223-2790(+)
MSAAADLLGIDFSPALPMNEVVHTPTVLEEIEALSVGKVTPKGQDVSLFEAITSDSDAAEDAYSSPLAVRKSSLRSSLTSIPTATPIVAATSTSTSPPHTPPVTSLMSRRGSRPSSSSSLTCSSDELFDAFGSSPTPSSSSSTADLHPNEQRLRSSGGSVPTGVSTTSSEALPATETAQWVDDVAAVPPDLSFPVSFPDTPPVVPDQYQQANAALLDSLLGPDDGAAPAPELNVGANAGVAVGTAAGVAPGASVVASVGAPRRNSKLATVAPPTANPLCYSSDDEVINAQGRSSTSLPGASSLNEELVPVWATAPPSSPMPDHPAPAAAGDRSKNGVADRQRNNSAPPLVATGDEELDVKDDEGRVGAGPSTAKTERGNGGGAGGGNGGGGASVAGVAVASSSDHALIHGEDIGVSDSAVIESMRTHRLQLVDELVNQFEVQMRSSFELCLQGMKAELKDNMVKASASHGVEARLLELEDKVHALQERNRSLRGEVLRMRTASDKIGGGSANDGVASDSLVGGLFKGFTRSIRKKTAGMFTSPDVGGLPSKPRSAEVTTKMRVLQCLHSTPYDSNNKHHVALLLSMWNALFPTPKPVTSVDECQWARLGIKNAELLYAKHGMLALQNIHHMATSYSAATRRMMDAQKGNKTTNYPFCLAAAHVTSMLGSVLGFSLHKGDEASPSQQSCFLAFVALVESEEDNSTMNRASINHTMAELVGRNDWSTQPQATEAAPAAAAAAAATAAVSPTVARNANSSSPSVASLLQRDEKSDQQSSSPVMERNSTAPTVPASRLFAELFRVCFRYLDFTWKQKGLRRQEFGKGLAQTRQKTEESLLKRPASWSALMESFTATGAM